MKRVFSLILCLMLAGSGLAACSSPEATAVENDTTVNTEKTEADTTTLAVPDKENTTDAQSSEAVVSEAEGTTKEAGHKVLVAYFSRTGNTRPLAEYAAAYYGADLYEIIAADPYTDADINYNDPSSRTTLEQNDVSARPKIDGSVAAMDQYDIVILAYPIWWGQAPRILSTFLESYDFSGKIIVPFCTSASSDIGSSDDNLHALVFDTVTWVDGKRFAAGTDEATLTAWLEEVCPK